MKPSLKIIVFTILGVIFGIAIGILIGIKYEHTQMQGRAIAYWMMGVDSLEKKQYDYALLYLSQATALRNDAVFYQSMAETYELKQNLAMALEFYKLALRGYKEEKAGPIKKMEQKVELLNAQVKEQK